MRRVSQTVSNPPQIGGGSSQTILLARRGRTIRMCSFDARSEGQSGYSLLKRNEQAWREHFIFQDLQLRTPASNRLIQTRECSSPTAPACTPACPRLGGADDNGSPQVGVGSRRYGNLRGAEM